MNHPSPFANAIRAIKIDYIRYNVSFALSQLTILPRPSFNAREKR